MYNCRHFKIPCQKSFISQIFRRPFKVLYKQISDLVPPNSEVLFSFFSRFLHFLYFIPCIVWMQLYLHPNDADTTAQTNFLHHSFSKFHDFHHSFLRFSTVPLLNYLQLQLHSSHFTTAKYILGLQLHKLSSVAR